jgi:hypothetical protein
MTKLTETTKVRPSELLAAAAAIAAGTQAYAEVIIFINPPEGEPGHFDWLMSPDEFDPAIWLDITRPSTDQGGLVGPSSIGQVYVTNSLFRWSQTSGGASVFALFWDFTPFWPGTVYTFSLSFESAAAHWREATSPPGGFGSDFGYYFPYYGDKYVGVRFSDVDGFHYGWVGVRGAGVGGWWRFQAFAWGYQTEPGVPITAGIPAPGTLAALAFGAVVTRRGRKRKDD